MKAVFLDFATMGQGLDISRMEEAFPDLTIFDVTQYDQVIERIHNVDFVFGNKVRMTREVIAASPGLRYIGLTATGTDNVDLEAAREHEVSVCNIRAYCTESVAEHVFGCLISLARNLGPINDAVRAGEWQTSDDFCLLSFPIREISAMTLGVVGFGELGRGVARIGAAFGMQVLVSERPGADTARDGRTLFEEVLKQADVISLHCPLTAETTNLFGADEFRRMKSDAILINTARGGLVDSAALVAALEGGDIGAAAIDVLPEEPPVNGNPLLDYTASNLLLTPHVAWATNEARQAAIDQLIDCALAFKNGASRNRVA